MTNDIKNLVMAVILSVLIMSGWQYFYEAPRQEKTKIQQQQILSSREKTNNDNAQVPLKHTEQAKGQIGKEIEISNDVLQGRFSTKGLKFTQLNLLGYNKSLTDKSPVELLSSAEYFAAFGFMGEWQDGFFPDGDTVWQADGKILTSQQPINFTWHNNYGVEFAVRIILDQNYLFRIEQTLINGSDKSVDFKAFALLNRKLAELPATSVAHEGVVAVFDGTLKEVKYSDLEAEKNNHHNIAKGWLGFADKYWITALVPEATSGFSSSFVGYKKDGFDRFQIDFLGNKTTVAPKSKTSVGTLFYAGPKDISLLDSYEIADKITLFDRAVDFGWFYFLTKPMYMLLKFLNGFLGNWGLSILALTLIVKLLMFPVANKSFRAMNKMKKLQPELDRLKSICGSDKMRLQQEMMALYKKNNVSTLSGCLPLLLQIPVFFSLYKVIYISIDLRLAPFYGWVKDLSVPDPTSITNLFGLLPYEPAAFLTIGILPILMSVTMYVQQMLSPPVADPMQAKVTKFLPLIFLFLFYSFPSGLLLYWTFSNIISIVQQYILLKLYKD